MGLRRKARHRGVARAGWRCTCAAAVSNFVQMRPLVQNPSAETPGKSACGLGHKLCTAALPYLTPHDVDTRQLPRPHSRPFFGEADWSNLV